MMKRFGSILLLLLIGLGAATQWAAYRVENVFVFHAPWALLAWALEPKGGQSAIVDQSLSAFMLYALIVFGLATKVGRGGGPKVKAFGLGGWGKDRDLKRAGLLAQQGVVVGVHRGKLLCYDGPEHQLVSGASRSGKGVGHVVPTLLCWGASALVYDVKGELWELTSGYRSASQHCLCFNPTRLDSARFNPLLEVRKGPCEVRDAQNLVEILINPDGSKKTLDVWDQNAFQFLTALVLHVLYTQPMEHKHLGRVRELLLDFDNTCRAMMKAPHRLDRQTGELTMHPEIAQVAKSLLHQAERFRSSVRGTAESYLTLWADPIVTQVTARSDFCLGDLVCLDKPVTLYVQPPPSDADRVRPLIRLLLNQTARALMEQRDCDNRGRTKRHKLLMLLDEFPTLGKLEFFAQNLRQMGGYGIKAMLVVQSFNDIVEYYGPHNTIIDNCHILCCFASADALTGQRISQMSGEVAEYRESYSRSGAVLGGRGGISQAEQVRPLLQPGQVRQLAYDQQLIFVTGFKPFCTPKLRYYEHPGLKRRIGPAPASGSVLCGTVPEDWSQEQAREPIVPQEVPEEVEANRKPTKQKPSPTSEGDPMLFGPNNESEKGAFF